MHRHGTKGRDEMQTIPLAITIWVARNAPILFVGELLYQILESAARVDDYINVNWLGAALFLTSLALILPPVLAQAKQFREI